MAIPTQGNLSELTSLLAGLTRQLLQDVRMLHRTAMAIEGTARTATALDCGATLAEFQACFRALADSTLRVRAETDRLNTQLQTGFAAENSDARAEQE